MRYIISYDLDNATTEDYNRIAEVLEGLGAQRVLLSQWVTRRTGTNARAIADYVWRQMRANDRLLVTCLDSVDWCAYRPITDPNVV